MAKLLMTLMLGLAILGSPVTVKAAEVKGAKIIRYGIYKTSGNDLVFLKQTTRIPARIGTSFGFEYITNGRPPGEKIYVRVSVQHPLITNPRTKRSSTRGYHSGPNKGIGRTSSVYYTFNHDWSAVPGRWTLKVMYRGKTLAEKSFQVIKP